MLFRQLVVHRMPTGPLTYRSRSRTEVRFTPRHKPREAMWSTSNRQDIVRVAEWGGGSQKKGYRV